jgi:hypothetical protein
MAGRKDQEMNKSEKFARLNGIEWQEGYTIWPSEDKANSQGFYPRTHVKGNNPTFTDAKSILEVMMKREDWNKFYKDKLVWSYAAIQIDYILNPDKLLEEAIKWCEEVRNET